MSHHDITTTTTTTKARSTSLFTFLQDDIQPEGRRLLLPFLTMNELLRLSECCEGLINYRHHLTRLKISPHSSASPGTVEGINQLLLDQEGKRLEYMQLRDKSLLEVLDLASQGRFEGLKTLVLSGIEMVDSDAVAYVERALSGGGLRGLVELDVGRNRMGSVGLRTIIRAITAGACPRLQRLILSNTDTYYVEDVVEMECVGQAVGEALDSGHCRHLQVLDLSHTTMSNGGAASLFKALEGGPCPGLVKLGLSNCEFSTANMRCIARAMREYALTELEELQYFYESEWDGEGWPAIFEAMRAGYCQNIQRLDFKEADFGVMASSALAHTLRSGMCHRLRHLNLNRAFDCGNASSALGVLEAMKEACLHDLRHLDLSELLLNAEHGRALGEAISAGALPNLEVLNLSETCSLGGDGVAHVMAGLEAGKCPHLEELYVTRSEMSPNGGQGLARALMSGNLSRLQVLEIGEEEGTPETLAIGDPVMVEVIEGLRHCPQLRDLDLKGTYMKKMAGQALIKALREGAWPHLYSLDVSCNGMVSFRVMKEGLAALPLETLCPKLTRVIVE